MELDKEKEFEKLMEDEANRTCCDCGINSLNPILGNVSPQWSSVNNGVFICYNCSGSHRTFGMQISFVKSLTMDSWTDRQLSLMKEGGNGKFKAFTDTYNLSQESPAIKYKTIAVEYYRKSVSIMLIFQLKAKAGNEAFDEPPPSIELGREVAPEFSQVLPAEPSQEKPKKNAFGYISDGFFTAFGAVKNAGIKAKNKIGESKVGKNIAGAASTAGHFVVDKTKIAATAVKNQGTKIAVRSPLPVAK